LGRTAKLIQVSKEHTTVCNRWCGQLQAKKKSLFKQQNSPYLCVLVTQSGYYRVFDRPVSLKSANPEYRNSTLTDLEQKGILLK